MSNDKEVIKKLAKIVENQQKIITKLAQMGGAAPLSGATSSWADVKDAVAEKLSTIPAAKGYQVISAEVAPSNGSLKGNLSHPENSDYLAVFHALKSELAGKALEDKAGKVVQVTTNPNDIRFVGSF